MTITDIMIIVAFILVILVIRKVINRSTQTSQDPRDTRFMALVVLRDNGSWMYGLDIIREIKKRWGKETRGIIYVDLNNMENAGEIMSREVESGGLVPNRRQYKIKGGGKRVLDEADLKWLSNTAIAPQ